MLLSSVVARNSLPVHRSMEVTLEDLERRCRDLADEVLLKRYVSGDLTAIAQGAARRELLSRGIPIPSRGSGDTPDDESGLSAALGGLVQVSGSLTYAEAEVLRSLLESEGVPALVVDAHMATTNQFLSATTGGVRILVHERNVALASEVIAAISRGDYQIDEDFDTGVSGDLEATRPKGIGGAVPGC